jgi:uncharacterized protein (TIGR02453 family)
MANFAGFSPEAMKFLKALKKNNDREWFQPRKETYEREWREPMIAMVEALQKDMLKFAPDYLQEPAKAVMRIYRDIRFSKNKTPYKTYVGAALRRNGLSKDGSASFYFHVDEKGLLIAGGVYMPAPDELRAIRNYLTEHYMEFGKLIRAPKLKSLMGDLHGHILTRAPKGFEPEHPAAEFVKRKQFYFHNTLAPEMVTTPAVYTELLARIKAMTPVVDFLNRPLLGMVKAKDGRFMSDFG